MADERERGLNGTLPALCRRDTYDVSARALAVKRPGVASVFQAL